MNCSKMYFIIIIIIITTHYLQINSTAIIICDVHNLGALPL